MEIKAKYLDEDNSYVDVYTEGPNQRVFSIRIEDIEALGGLISAYHQTCRDGESLCDLGGDAPEFIQVLVQRLGEALDGTQS